MANKRPDPNMLQHNNDLVQKTEEVITEYSGIACSNFLVSDSVLGVGGAPIRLDLLLLQGRSWSN